MALGWTRRRARTSSCFVAAVRRISPRRCSVSTTASTTTAKQSRRARTVPVSGSDLRRSTSPPTLASSPSPFIATRTTSAHSRSASGTRRRTLHLRSARTSNRRSRGAWTRVSRRRRRPRPLGAWCARSGTVRVAARGRRDLRGGCGRVVPRRPGGGSGRGTLRPLRGFRGGAIARERRGMRGAGVLVAGVGRGGVARGRLLREDRREAARGAPARSDAAEPPARSARGDAVDVDAAALRESPSRPGLELAAVFTRGRLSPDRVFFRTDAVVPPVLSPTKSLRNSSSIATEASGERGDGLYFK